MENHSDDSNAKLKTRALSLGDIGLHAPFALIHLAPASDSWEVRFAVFGRMRETFPLMPSRLLTLLPVLAALLAVVGCRDGKIATYRIPKEAAPAAAVNATDPSTMPADPHAGLGIPPPSSPNAPAPKFADISSGTKDSTPAADPAPSAPFAPFAGGGGNAMANMANTAVPTASGTDLIWTAPTHWRLGPPMNMRKATLVIPGAAGDKAELTVTAFPGNVGGNLANVNRWRAQVQLGPISEAEMNASFEHLDVGVLHLDVVEILGPATSDGKPRQRLLGAIVPFEKATWFFKLTGPDALVSGEKASYFAFLKTLKPAQ